MKNLKLIIPLFITTLILTSATVPSGFSDNTKFHWRLEVTNDETTEVFEGGRINSILETKHTKMKITCAPPKLEKEHIKYHPKKDTGYTRDEERSRLNCSIDGIDLTSRPVVCAKSYAKNKIGQVASDSTDYIFKNAKSSFSIALSCILK